METGLSQSNYINCLPFHPPNFPFQQPYTKERSLVSLTWWRKPLSALLSPSPYKPSSPQGGRCPQAPTEGASQGPPARAWWVGDGVTWARFLLRTILQMFLTAQDLSRCDCWDLSRWVVQQVPSKLVLFATIRLQDVGTSSPFLVRLGNPMRTIP